MDHLEPIPLWTLAMVKGKWKPALVRNSLAQAPKCMLSIGMLGCAKDGTVVTDREKVEIKSNLDLEKIFVNHIEEIEKKSKFNLWKFLSLKKYHFFDQSIGYPTILFYFSIFKILSDIIRLLSMVVGIPISSF